MPKAQTDAEWSDKAKNLLRSELKRKGVTYAQLSGMLEIIGVDENEKNIANKISRGVFTMAFFLQCMAAIEVTELRLLAIRLKLSLRIGLRIWQSSRQPERYWQSKRIQLHEICRKADILEGQRSLKDKRRKSSPQPKEL